MNSLTLNLDELPTELFDDVMRFLNNKKYNKQEPYRKRKLHFGAMVSTRISLIKHKSWDDFLNNPGPYRVEKADDCHYAIKIDTPNFNGVLYVSHGEYHSDEDGRLHVQIDPLYLNQLSIDLRDDFHINTTHYSTNDKPYGFYDVNI